MIRTNLMLPLVLAVVLWMYAMFDCESAIGVLGGS
jgi:hypothetical protein